MENLESRFRRKSGKKESSVVISDPLPQETDEDNLILSKTYAELKALKNSKSLIAGQHYLISDFQTTWLMSTGDLFTGDIEEIVIQAATTDSFYETGKSLNYPEDIIYYDFDSTLNGSSKGQIYRRVDIKMNNDIGLDWRTIKFRRWAVKVTNSWTPGQTYGVGEVVVNGTQILICVRTDKNWGGYGNFIVFVYGNGAYISPSANSLQFNLTGQLNITIPVNADDYKDFKLFNPVNYPETIRNNKIVFLASDIPNMVFLGNNIENNEINRCCGAVTIGTSFQNNKVSNSSFELSIIGSNCQNNDFNGCSHFYLGDIVQDNKFVSFTYSWLGNYAQRNKLYCVTQTYMGRNIKFNDFINREGTSNSVFYGDCENNVVTGLMNGNVVDYSFRFNKIQGNLSNNVIGESFIKNTTKNDFNTNTIKQGFMKNTIENTFENNSIGTYFCNNTTSHEYSGNTIGDNCQYCSFEKYTYSNTIGDNCQHCSFSAVLNGCKFASNLTYVNVINFWGYGQKDFTSYSSLYNNPNNQPFIDLLKAANEDWYKRVIDNSGVYVLTKLE